MSPYDEIVEQVWLENKHIFRSKKEIEAYLFRYFKIVEENLKAKEHIYFSGLGPIMLTKNAYGKRKKNRREKELKPYLRLRRYFNSVTSRFIDISFPD